MGAFPCNHILTRTCSCELFQGIMMVRVMLAMATLYEW